MSGSWIHYLLAAFAGAALIGLIGFSLLVTVGGGDDELGSGLATAVGRPDETDGEPVPRAATPAVASVRIEGDDTALTRLLAGMFGASPGTSVEIIAGELPPDFPENFPPPFDAELLGGQTTTFSGFGGAGHSGMAVYRSDAEPEAAIEGLRAAATGTGWWEPETPDFFPRTQQEIAMARFCRDDWARTGLSTSTTAIAHQDGGSYLTVHYTIGQAVGQCDPQQMERGSAYTPPQLIFSLQGLLPEGAEPDFRFGGGTSGSDSTYSTSTGFRFDGSALTVARFYEREFAALDARTGEPTGDEISAVLRLAVTEPSAGEDDEDRESIGWLLVTRFEDAEEPEQPLIHVSLTLMSLPDGIGSGFSFNQVIIQSP